jgi:hypothetical protein
MKHKRRGKMQTAVAAQQRIEIPRHGYDGNPPELRSPQDFAGADRELPERENYNVDRIRWLYRHGHIDAAQNEAGERLQRDWQLAQLGGYSAAGNGGGKVVNLVPSNLPDAKLDAIGRVNRARAKLDRTSWRLVELVVLENIQLAEAAKRLWGHTRRGEAVTAICYALDLLAAVYGLA